MQKIDGNCPKGFASALAGASLFVGQSSRRRIGSLEERKLLHAYEKPSPQLHLGAEKSKIDNRPEVAREDCQDNLFKLKISPVPGALRQKTDTLIDVPPEKQKQAEKSEEKEMNAQ